MTASERREKADRAIGALAKYPDGTGSITDLLTDLMHLCDRVSIPFDDVLDVARRNYEAEAPRKVRP